MNPDRLELLQETLALQRLAAEHLAYSLGRCLALHHAELSLEDLERLESMTSRFARLSDLFMQKTLRLIDQIDFEDEGTLRDRLNRAEKKGLIDSADQFKQIRELRNAIAHEYELAAMRLIFDAVKQHAPTLLDAVDRSQAYAQRFVHEQER